MLKSILALSDGARYYKADLHVHTPHDPERYERKGDLTVADVIEGAKAAGVEVIAITDHNCARGVDEAKAIGDREGVAVFPGVELTTFGGKPNVHIIVIFDRDADARRIEDFIGKTGIPMDEICTTEAVSTMGTAEVLSMRYECVCIAIAAHSKSSSGLFKAMSGQSRIAAYQGHALLAVEIPDEDNTDLPKVRRICEGRDTNYGPKCCAMIRSSDARSPAEIGSRHTWLKMSDPPSLEGLRQAFLDFESRVRFERPEVTFPYIIGVAVEGGGFLGRRDEQPGMRVHFNPYLNCIIGGRGTGKSAIIEVMRYALGMEPRLSRTRERTSGLVNAALGAGGKVTVFFEVGGQKYQVSRILDLAPRVFDAEGAEQLLVPPDRLFPAKFYGQGEILEVAEDDSFQLEMLDRFIAGDLEPLQDRKSAMELELKANQSAILDLARQIETGEEKQQRLEWIRLRLLTFKKQGIEELMTTAKGYQLEQEFFSRLLEDIQDATDRLEEMESALPNPSRLMDEEVLVTLPNESLIRRCRELFADCVRGARKNLTGHKKALTDCQAEIQGWRQKEWEHLFQAQEEEYAKRLQELQSQGIAQPEDYLKLEGEKNTLELLMREVQKLQQKIDKDLLPRREELLNKWEEVRWTIYGEREAQAARLTEQLAAQVQVRVTHAGAHAALRDCLKKAFDGTSIEGKWLNVLADHCASPQEVAKRLMTLRADPSAYHSYLLAAIGLDEETAGSVANALNDDGLSQLRGWPWGKQEQQRDGRRAFIEYLRGVYRGSKIREAVLQEVVDHFSSPRDLAVELYRRQSGATNGQDILGCLNLSDTAMGSLVNHLDRQALFELQTFEMTDQPHIELVVGGEPRSIFELSIGQKCTAILTLLLVESDVPLLVDQPEDSLDNKFIYDEVVRLLRREKEQRQFVIATHNANIPVLGDAELILALEAEKDHGWIEQRNSMDNTEVQEAVKKILEGGKEAFERRREKYGF
ncbi:MAG: AAA family ATPase [Chloroflexota bacterium]